MRLARSKNGINARAYAATTGVMLALDVPAGAANDFLGFAIERHTARRGQEWLQGQLHFQGMGLGARLHDTNEAPIQKFRWSDYRVYPDEEITYKIHAAHGVPGQLQLTEGPELKVRTTSTTPSGHQILFNRAVAASQAFSDRFKDEIAELKGLTKPSLFDLHNPKPVLDWLSRGLVERIHGFIGQATDNTWQLDVLIYEFHLESIVEAVLAAQQRGVTVRLVTHAKTGVQEDTTDENRHNGARFASGSWRQRETAAICHHKFIVLSRKQGGQVVPHSVLTGSTNFTENGVYRQANCIHVTQDAGILATYSAVFANIWRGDSPSLCATWNHANNSVDLTGLRAHMSPRKQKLDLKAFTNMMGTAHSDVMFATAFDIDDNLEEALLGETGDDILRIGLQNRKSSVIGTHRDRSERFTVPAAFDAGARFLQESFHKQKGTLYVHTKILVRDFATDSPVVVSGSHNFSGAASTSNDENWLVIPGDPDVADLYGVEIMRFYDHYRARSVAKRGRSTTGSKDLRADSSWATKYYDPAEQAYLERIRLCP